MQGKQRRLTEERLPPYVSYRTWQNLLKELSSHTPSRFDGSYFDILKVTKSCRSMLKGTLLFMDLMSPEGSPTAKLHHLVKSDGEARRVALAEIIRNAYGPLFTDIDVTHATPNQVRDYFNSQGASGDIGRKCLSFFFAIAAEANISLSPQLRKSVSRGKGKKDGADDVSRHKVSKSVELQWAQAWQKALLEKFPDFNPEWPDDVKKKWFEGFKFLKMLLETSTSGRKSSLPRR